MRHPDAPPGLLRPGSNAPPTPRPHAKLELLRSAPPRIFLHLTGAYITARKPPKQPLKPHAPLFCRQRRLVSGIANPERCLTGPTRDPTVSVKVVAASVLTLRWLVLSVAD